MLYGASGEGSQSLSCPSQGGKIWWSKKVIIPQAYKIIGCMQVIPIKSIWNVT